MIDVLRQAVQTGSSLDIASSALSLFAFIEIRDLLNHSAHSRLILPLETDGDLMFLGSAADRAARNRLQAQWLARECAKLNPEFEQSLAEEGLSTELEEWPEY